MSRAMRRPVAMSIGETPGLAETVTFATAAPAAAELPASALERAGMPASTSAHREEPRRSQGTGADRAGARRAQAGPDEREARTQPPALGSGGLTEQDQDRAPRAHDRERTEQRHLGPELGRLRCDQERREEADADGIDPPGDPAPSGTVFGSVIMNERKMKTSGERISTRQK